MGSDYVQSLERGLAVIRLFSRERPSLTLVEVADATGLTRATARRLLLTLQALGYVRFDRREYSLTPKVLTLGYSYMSSLDLGSVVRQPLLDLVARTGEAAAVTVLDDVDVVYVARVPGERMLTVDVGVGSRMPAYPTSMGRVLLAALAPDDLDRYFARAELRPLTPRTVSDEVRLREILREVADQGWALVDGELEEGLRGIAVPLHDATGQVTAAIHVSTHGGRVSATQFRRHMLPLLRGVADEIDDILARRQPVARR